MKRLTQKRKDIMLGVLSTGWAHQALWTEDEEGEAFVELYDYTREEALEALEALKEFLAK